VDSRTAARERAPRPCEDDAGYQEERERELAQLRGEHVEAGWGNQIRSYVLHPYQMVKDHRTNLETSATHDVLDGDLDAFMQAELERLATGGGRVALDDDADEE